MMKKHYQILTEQKDQRRGETNNGELGKGVEGRAREKNQEAYQ